MDVVSPMVIVMRRFMSRAGPPAADERNDGMLEGRISRIIGLLRRLPGLERKPVLPHPLGDFHSIGDVCARRKRTAVLARRFYYRNVEIPSPPVGPAHDLVGDQDVQVVAGFHGSFSHSESA